MLKNTRDCRCGCVETLSMFRAKTCWPTFDEWGLILWRQHCLASSCKKPVCVLLLLKLTVTFVHLAFFVSVVSWLYDTVVERRSLAGKLSLSCAWPAAVGWPLLWWTIRYWSANQANSVFHALGVDKWLISWNRMCAAVYGLHHLVKAIEVTADLAESNGSLSTGWWFKITRISSGPNAQ